MFFLQPYRWQPGDLGGLRGVERRGHHARSSVCFLGDDDEVKTQTPTGIDQSKLPPPEHRDLNEKVQSPDEMNPIRS